MTIAKVRQPMNDKDAWTVLLPASAEPPIRATNSAFLLRPDIVPISEQGGEFSPP